MDKKITIIGRENSIFNQFLYELREVNIQQDRMRFRKNLYRCSQIVAYELSKHMDFVTKPVTTPLGELEMQLPTEQPVLVSILRAGVPMHQGFLDFFDNADNGFISAYRQKTKGNDFVIKVEYAAMPSVEGRTVILIDPMIASGRSIALCAQAISPAHGTPSKIFLAGLIASEEGIDYVRRHVTQAHIFVGAVDNELTAKAYIVPGLGDAGDLAYGSKTSG
jgi:uracil phosphoribosyltransferase